MPVISAPLLLLHNRTFLQNKIGVLCTLFWRPGAGRIKTSLRIDEGLQRAYFDVVGVCLRGI